MITYRPFLNNDPPAIAEIWRSQPPRRALVQPMTPTILDARVLSKPYFDRQGLILAVDEDGPLGFVHTSSSASTNELGIISMLMVASRADVQQAGGGLLRQAECRLRDTGAQTVLAGEIPPHNPFYLGLYGGSNSPGILLSDTDWQGLLAVQGYENQERQAVLQRSLSGFRPAVDRRIMQVRRQGRVECDLDPPTADWRSACTVGQTDRTQFRLTSRAGESLASVCYWDMEPLASSWGVHAAGILDIRVEERCRRQGMATFLLGESLRKLQSQGITLVEVQVPIINEPALQLFAKLGFEQIDEGIPFAKRLASG